MSVSAAVSLLMSSSELSEFSRRSASDVSRQVSWVEEEEAMSFPLRLGWSGTVSCKSQYGWLWEGD